MCKYCNHIQKSYFANPNPGDLKVWWNPQIPMKSFEYPVISIREAKLALDMLAQYDLFQLEHNVKGDYSNAGGLLLYEDVDGEGNFQWCDWANEDGNSIDEVDENGDSIE